MLWRLKPMSLYYACAVCLSPSVYVLDVINTLRMQYRCFDQVGFGAKYTCSLQAMQVTQFAFQVQISIYWTWPFPSTAMLSSPNTGLPNPMSSVGAGQTSTPTINTSTPIDPSSMQRAYAALGLTYSSQTPGQTQAQGAVQTSGATNTQTQQTLPPQLRPVSAIGKDCFTSSPTFPIVILMIS